MAAHGMCRAFKHSTMLGNEMNVVRIRQLGDAEIGLV
jgi:hypothetical protein